MNLDYASDARSAAFEKDHWWVRSRFGLMDRVLQHFDSDAVLTVLEVGCGTGINLDYLETHYGRRLGRLLGVDPEAELVRSKGREIRRDIPPEESFDLILAMDVLEHVNDPVDLLTRLRAHLKASGQLLVSVPAFPWLGTTYDTLAHHRKRYTQRELVSELQAAHFVIEERFFLFGLLFPFFVIQRLALKWRPQNDARLFKPTAPWLNRVLYALTSLEMRTIMPYNRWFGSSVVAIAHRENPS